MKKYIYLIIICFSGVVNAQSGPAGVGSSVTNNFWLDANALAYSNGSPVSVFTDVSGNGNDFSQFSSVKQPVFSTGAINGLPALVFDGTSDCMLSSSISAIESSELTWFVVYKKAPLSSQGIIGGNYGTSTADKKLWESYCNASNNAMVNSHYSSGGIKFNTFIDDGSSFNFLTNIVTSSQLKTYKNGSLQGTKSAVYSAPSNHNYVSLGRFPSSDATSYYLDGQIAEAFVFNKALNDLERVLVENYLGAKYGFSIPTDLYSFQGVHNMGLIGLGNDGVNTHLNSKGNGILQISNPTSLDVNEYYFVGHDGTDLATVVNSDMPVPVSTHSRLSRTWRVDETGDLGNVTLEFDVTGSAGFAEPATYNLLVDADADGDFSNSLLVAGVFTSGKMKFTTDLPSGATFTLSGIPTVPSAIHSIASGDWSDINSWDCGCVPTLSDTVYIETGFTIGVDVDAYAFNINVDLPSTLKMTEDFTLSVYGDLFIGGNILMTDGEIAFTGANAQTLSGDGSTFDLNNILIDNSGNANVTFVDGEYILNNVLNINNGNLIIDNDGDGLLIVNSTSSSTSGRIGLIPAASTISGNVTVRRFLPAGAAGERNISSPVVGANLSEWDEEISISGTGFPDGCAADVNGCYFSCKKFEGGEFGTDYIDVTNPSEPLESGRGYELFIGDDLNTFSGATISSTGALRSGTDFVFNSMSFGWNLVGNPYASPISFSTVSTNKLHQYFYVYDAGSGSYQWYDLVSNSSSIPELANGNLAIGQGYWVYCYSNNAPSITYKQSDKISGIATFIKEAQTLSSINLALTQEGTTYRNVVSVGFNSAANDDKDSLDLVAFTLGKQKASSLYINAEDELLAKNNLNTNGRDKVLDLSVKILNDGYFTISASNLENVLNYKSITLVDNFTGDVIDMRSVRGYSFYANADEDINQRFQLILSNDRIENNEITIFESEKDDSDLTITQLGNAINIQAEESIEGITEVSVINLLGQNAEYTESIKIEAGSNMLFIPENLSGMYLVVIKSANGVKTKKIML